MTPKVYSKDPFDADYGAGYFCLVDYDASVGKVVSDASGVSWGYNGIFPGWGWYGTNREKRTDYYVNYYNGACMNGVYYDVREYDWCTGCNYYAVSSGAVTSYNNPEGQNESFFSREVHREFHFYKAGTLKSDNPVEVSFRGVIQLSDLDGENGHYEGYRFDQGLIGIWLNDPTWIINSDPITGETGGKSWYSTDGANNEPQSRIWAEVEGTPEQPLMLTYLNDGLVVSGINFQGEDITYRFVQEGSHALPEGLEDIQTGCATYSNYNLMTAPQYDHYRFNGWYYDEALTQKVPDTIMVTEDQVFYGSYRRTQGDVTTEVIGGKISDSVTNVEFGSDVTIQYSPLDGYVLDSVTVDGQQVDPEQYPDTYEFKNIQDDHAIKVVYVQGKAPVKAVSKGGVNVEKEVLTSGDEVRYSITVQNPTLRPRDIVVYDEVDERLRICAVEDGGEADGQAIAWLLEDVPAGSSVTVHFRAAVIGQSTEQEIGNVAYMHMSGGDVLPSNEVKVVVAPVPTPTTDVIHKTREETETIRTINYETVTKVIEVPQVAVPTVAQVEPIVEPVVEDAAPVVAEAPAVSAVIATGDDSLMWAYLAAAGAAALTLAVWFARNARQMR